MEERPVPSYEKIPEKAARWGLSEAGFRALSKVPWAVTEKIHGANLCLVAGPEGLRASSRSRWLGDDEDFFGHRAVMTRLRGPMMALLGALSPAPRVLVYGEICGGAYPHPDVAPVAGVQPVQTGVWYAPGIEFFAFDVAVEGDDGGKRYLGWEQASALLAQAGVPTAPLLLVGAYDEAISHGLGFSSVVPALLGLPPIAGNRAEGVVVRPMTELLVTDERGKPVRPTLKKKLDDFAEDERFHGAQRWEQAPAGELGAIKQHASWMVNEPRLAAVRSKLGPVERHGEAGRRQLVEAIVADVLVSLGEEWGERLGSLGAADRGRLEAHVRGDSETLVELFIAEV